MEITMRTVHLNHLLALADGPDLLTCPSGFVCRRLRRYLQVPLTDIAAAVGASESTLRRYETGRISLFADREVGDRLARVMAGLNTQAGVDWEANSRVSRSGRYAA